MASLIFVHGTGVRQEAFEVAMESIWAHLHEALIKHHRGEIRLEPCLWGNSLGSRLNAKGASVPDYDLTGKAKTAAEQDCEDRITLWEMLAYDSLYELHGLALRPRENEIDADAFTDMVKKLPSETMAEKLSRAGIAKTFSAARDYVLNADVYEDSLASATDPSDCRGPVARAIVARATALTPDDRPPAIRFDPPLRDEVIEAITGELGEPTKGVVGWTANTLFKLAQRLHIVDLKYRRGALTDSVAPETGDIVLYQANGDPIRGFIREKIDKAHKDNPPVVVMAHSLGGIACVDLFARPKPPPAHRAGHCRLAGPVPVRDQRPAQLALRRTSPGRLSEMVEHL